MPLLTSVKVSPQVRDAEAEQLHVLLWPHSPLTQVSIVQMLLSSQSVAPLHSTKPLSKKSSTRPIMPLMSSGPAITPPNKIVEPTER